jgi:DeoR family transcriptional regulator of aga operon
MKEANTTVGRRAAIIKTLQADGQVSVSGLSRQYRVSEVTIRNDLTQLEKKNLLIRTRGGAFKKDLVAADIDISEKQRRHHDEKELIGIKAAALIHDGETIILDSGSTTVEIAKNLGSHKELSVITNALNIASILAGHSDLRVIMPGGFLRHNSLSLVGYPAEENLRNYRCDKLFLGVDGIDATYGLSTPNIEEAHLNRLMIEVVKEVIVVTDSSKFRRKSFAFIASMDKVHTIVTDKGIPDSEYRTFLEMGIKIHLVETAPAF